MSDKNFEAAKITGAFGMAENAETLLEKMRDSCPQYIPTGFPELDSVLNGGLTASLYVLGAMPSLGKSTFLINMSEMIARSGTPVLYFSLEMPADHIARGTFCRCLFNAEKEKNGLPEAKRSALSASEFLKVSSFNEEKLKTSEKKEIWNNAFKQYRKTGENFYVIDRNYISDYTQDESTIAASFVRKYVEDFIRNDKRLAEKNRKKEKQEKRNVVVIMDYLQLLRPEENMKNPTERNVIDHSIAELWKLAHSNKIPVIAISSINRTSYNEPVTLSSFKESGGIEFSADVVWGLQLKGAGEKNNSEADKIKDRRDMQLVVLKNRYGSRDHIIDLEFHTKFGIYIESKGLRAENHNEARAEMEEPIAAAKTKAAEVSASVPADSSEKNNRTEISALKNIINNTKIANDLRNGNIKTSEKYSSHIDEKRKFYVTYMLKYKGADKSVENKSLTFLDCAVMDAVMSHYRRSGGRDFTACDLLKFMSGRDRITNSYAKNSIEEKIERSLLKLKDTEMTIDITDDVKMQIQKRKLNYQVKNKLSCLLTGKRLATAAKALGVNGDPEERIILRGLLLPIQKNENGSFRMDDNKTPLLYEYGNMINDQIITYSPELLKTDNMHLSETALLERYFLVCRIELLKYKLRTDPRAAESFKKIVLYNYRERSGMIPKITALAHDGSYSDYIDSEDFKRIKKNIINETTRSLDYLKDQNYISSYTVKNNVIEIEAESD